MRRQATRRAMAAAVGILLFSTLTPDPALANALPYYYLPWDVGASRQVTQGNNQGDHTGFGAYAWDFAGDGWLVRAARPGTVSLLKDDSQTGGCDPSYASYGNFVKVDTHDGYENLYLHLAYGSVRGRVNLTQPVASGAELGLTDNTGWSCGSHLHYQVQSQCSSYWCQSVPSSFLDPDVLRQDSDGVPRLNQTVVSANDARPAVAISNNAGAYVFWKGTDSNLWEAQGSASGALSGPYNRGMGPLGSAPAVGVDGNGATYMYWEGSDRNLWEGYWSGTQFVGPVFRGMGPLASPPAVAINANGGATVFWDGSDGNLWEAQGSGSGALSGPYNRGMGHLGSTPAVGVDGSGASYIYWEGTDRNLWEGYWNGTQFVGPYSRGMGPLG